MNPEIAQALVDEAYARFLADTELDPEDPGTLDAFYDATADETDPVLRMALDEVL